MDTKKCSKCGEIKSVSEFGISKRDGIRSQCKICRNKKSREYAIGHKEQYSEWQKQDRIKNKVKYMIRESKYKEKYPEKASEASRKSYKKNKEQVLERSKNRYYNNKEEIRQQHKEWRINNKVQIKDYHRDRYHNDIKYRITEKLRKRISVAIREQYTIKAFSSIELLGCNIESIRQHLEDQFTEGMSWDNYGLYGWHIDHIKPCAKFDLTDPEQQKECFHYSNLQPLWAFDNLSKGDKWEEIA